MAELDPCHHPRLIESNPGGRGLDNAASDPARTLRHRYRRAEWQVSWGFQGRPVDWHGVETAENRSPEANSLRTS